MNHSRQQSLKDRYQNLRRLSCSELWNQEVAFFNQASAPERMDQIALIRAVGVVFSESGTDCEKADARHWLCQLLKDPQEKIRRYAIQAIPKLAGSPVEEASLLALLKTTKSVREKESLIEALAKIGGKATLKAGTEGAFEPSPQTLLRVEANVARTETPSVVLYEKIIADLSGIQIQLRCRKGLQEILREEIQSSSARAPKFRIHQVLPERVRLTPAARFSLRDLYGFRTFTSAAFILGTLESDLREVPLEAAARLIASPVCERILATLTRGPLRYRIEFLFKTPRGKYEKAIAGKAYALNPRLLNDPSNAPWEIQILRVPKGYSVELTPKFRPDPRFAYRTGDVPAASHPPIAAALARIAGVRDGDSVWDPFCGSGLELAERCLLGGVSKVFGTDLEAMALETTRANILSALPSPPSVSLFCGDFRQHRKVPGLEKISLVITNPPLGKRVPVSDLSRLIEDLFDAASEVLQTGGRLVLVNPLEIRPKASSLRLTQRIRVDLGCFYCHIEKYEKGSEFTPNPSGSPFSRGLEAHSRRSDRKNNLAG